MYLQVKFSLWTSKLHDFVYNLKKIFFFKQSSLNNINRADQRGINWKKKLSGGLYTENQLALVKTVYF